MLVPFIAVENTIPQSPKLSIFRQSNRKPGKPENQTKHGENKNDLELGLNAAGSPLGALFSCWQKNSRQEKIVLEVANCQSRPLLMGWFCRRRIRHFFSGAGLNNFLAQLKGHSFEEQRAGSNNLSFAVLSAVGVLFVVEKELIKTCQFWRR